MRRQTFFSGEKATKKRGRKLEKGTVGEKKEHGTLPGQKKRPEGRG